MKKTILLIFCCSLHWMMSKAQDLGFSQFYATPQIYNPAFTGYLHGDVRAMAVYKGLWENPFDAYRTVGGGVDMGISRIKMRGSGFGVGLHVFSDKAGDLDFNTNQIHLSAAYSQRLGDYKPNVLSAGFQLTIANRFLDLGKAKFDPDQGGETDFAGIDNYWYATMGLGLLWYLEPRDRINFYIGVSAFNLLRPDQSFYTDGRDRLMVRYVAQGGLQFEPNEKWILNPSLLYQRQGPFQEVSLGAFLLYKFSDNRFNRLHAGGGLWHRVGDALVPAFRMEYNDLNFIFSYNINISSIARVNRANGGPEVSLTYNGWWSKDKKKQMSRRNDCKCPFL